MADPLDSLESEEEYQKKADQNAKKYKVAKPGDKGVQEIKLEADEPKAPPSPQQRSAMINALKKD
jgi:hypothetical protein